MATYRAIYGTTGLDRYALQAVPPIHIIVDNGKVTLEGVVANEADKNMAGVKANGVSGVFSVANNLRVEKATRSSLLLRAQPVPGTGLGPAMSRRPVTSTGFGATRSSRVVGRVADDVAAVQLLADLLDGVFESPLA